MRSGIELASNFLGQLWGYNIERDWCLFSEIMNNSAIIRAAIDEETAVKVAIAIAPIKAVYQIPSLHWVEATKNPSTYIARIESVVKKYSNRFEQPYLTMLATVVYSMGLAGKVHFAPGTVPNVEAIVTKWGSAEAELAAAEVRAFSMAFFPHDRTEASEEWCRKFWRVNYTISKCEL